MHVTARYSPAAMFLHWTMAVLIITSLAMGQLFDVIPKEWDDAWLNAHAILGTLILLLLLVRIGLRLARPPPDLPADLPEWQKWASHATHAGLYLLMLAVPTIGLVALFARGKGIDLGLFAIASPIERARDLARAARGLHALASNIILVLAGLHIAAALAHRFFWKDGVLDRMLPGRA